MSDKNTDTRNTPSLDRLVGKARLVLGFERLWPALVRLGTICALYAALSFSGFFEIAPVWLRIASLLCFAGLVLYAFFRLFQFRLPDIRNGLQRLDRDSAVPHRPVAAATDSLGLNDADPATAALWKLHQERARRSLSQIIVKPPAPDVARLDPAALRYGALIAAIAAFFVAGTDWKGRLSTAFDWRNSPVVTVPLRLDAWVDPPSYTNRPPIFLSRAAAAGEKGADDKGESAILVPVGSILILRAAPPEGVAYAPGGLLVAKDKIADKNAAGQTIEPVATNNAERRFTVNGDGDISITRNGRVVARYRLRSIPDLPPKVESLGVERTTEGDGLKLRYKVEDDYGIASGEAIFEKIPGKDSKDGKPTRSLVEPPRIALSVPQTSGTAVEGETSADLSEHPFAGARLRMNLSVKDDIGQTGVSEFREMVIPPKLFANPLAKALAEQRRNIVMYPDNRERPAIALDALLVEPAAFGTPVAAYTGIKMALARLKLARTDAQLLDVADWLWQMALVIEDGDLSAAEKALRAAQERLKEAIDRGASPEEIKRLTEDMRRAMDRYAREFAQKNRGKQNAEKNADAKLFNQEDMAKILEKIEELMREGKTADAQALLEKLNEMLRNMQVGEGGPGGQDEQKSGLEKQSEELDRLLKDEQRLRDRTYREGQERQRGDGGKNQQGNNGQQGKNQGGGKQGQNQQGQSGDQQADGSGEGQQPGGTLQNRQQRLRDELGKLRDRMKELGAEGEQGLADAESAMREAENALRQGQNGRAVENQGKALEGLRKGRDGLAKQLGELGQGSEMAEGRDQRGRNGGLDSGLDPLGRRLNDGVNGSDGANNKRLNADGKGGGSIEERSRAVLEELRRRFGETYRPQLELDYIERLLRQN